MCSLKRAALLPAAGSGTRLGLGPKAFLQLGRLTLLEHATGGLQAEVDEILVAVPAALLAEARALLPGCTVIAGGASRQETVRLLALATDAETVLVHDAARPFLPAAVTRRVLAAASRHGAASAALDVADTLVRADGTAVPREGLKAVQTPQGFRRELLLAAQQQALQAGQTEATDEATLLRNSGHEVRLVPGSAWLFKITTGSDLELARAVEPAWSAARQRGGTLE
jgi:2-C-methyl-D-erythritol 4-phosphate cytidylyltransferase